MDEKEKYALEWERSAKFFQENNSYKHLSIQIDDYKVVLEIGCGTGHSTLSLLQKGHSVISVEKNPFCITKAKELIQNEGFTICDDISNMVANSVCFIECDITEPRLLDGLLNQISIDIVVCWNAGTYWDKEMFSDSLPKMLKYGLTVEQVRANPESSYCELIIWTACSIAKRKNCGVHIVDRGTQKIRKQNDTYYLALKREFGFKSIKYQNLKSTTISLGGRKLSINGKLTNQIEIPIIFISILMS